jgi:hypothetical protein
MKKVFPWMSVLCCEMINKGDEKLIHIIGRKEAAEYDFQEKNKTKNFVVAHELYNFLPFRHTVSFFLTSYSIEKNSKVSCSKAEL